MSLILDALNKADNERSKNTAPSLNSNHDENYHDAPANGNLKLIPVTVVAAVCLVAIIAFLVLRNPAKPAPSARDITARTPAQSNVQTPPKSKPVAEAPAASEPANDRSELNTYAKMKEKLIAAQYENAERAESSNTRTTNNAPEKTQESSKVASIYDANNVAPTPTAAPTPQKPAKTNTLEDYPTLGFIHDLPYSVQKSIPTIMYTEHSYNGSSSTVTINSATRRKGQQVASKLMLEEIVEDGIVLKFDTQRFKMSALNSWVNM